MVSDDRGQLLLTGSVLVALVIVSSVVLLNGMQFTENVGDENGVSEAEQADHARDLVRTDMDRLFNRTGTRRYAASKSDLEDDIDTYNEYHRQMTTRRQLADVEVELVASESKRGTVLYQHERSGEDFQPAAATINDWTLATNVEEVPVIVLEDVDVSSLSPTSPFVLALSQDPTHYWQLELYENRIVVQNQSGGSQSSQKLCDWGSRPVPNEFDVVIKGGHTQVVADDVDVSCDTPDDDLYDMRDEFTSNPDLEFENSGSVEGNYTITVDGTVPSGRFSPSPLPDARRSTPPDPQIINPAIRVTYNGTEIRTVSVFKLYDEVPE
ncbi:hypothetical protein VB773_08670 [Haloarculaceae archaeon H-GB2-1]|nr:hypothetical protein [Haloarculaceae archaeon H-GB1-1]MEA5386126.1 hypothetical protein [Haloarculaceae archaeon H-GB11]MEA5407632.1 hypothetical protein [Haloarculaceae archaeon H-GB2-1]